MDGTSILAAALAVALVAALVALWRTHHRALFLAEACRSLQEVRAQLQRARDDLVRERESFQALIDALPDQVFAKDTESRFLVVNQAAARQLRVEKPEDALGRTDLDFFPREEAEAYRREEAEVVATGKALVDKRVPFPFQGATRWLSTTKAPLYDRAGKLIGIAGANRDITDRKRAEEALERERDLLYALMESIPDHIYFKDLEGRFTRVNRSLARDTIFKTPEALIGKTDFHVMDAGKAQAYRDDEVRMLAAGRPMVDKRELAVFGGQQRWLSTTKAPILGPDGKPTGIVGINRDVTASQEAEEVLNDVVARARCLLWDARVREQGQGYHWDFRLHTSDATRRELGLDRLPGEADGEVWPRHIPPGQLEQMNRLCYTALKSGAPGYQQEFLFRGAQGEEHWLKEDVKITRTAAGEYHLVGVCLDITERKRAEAALRDREYLLRQVLDTNPNLIFVKDREGRIVLANAAFAAFYRSTVDRVTGLRHAELHAQKGGRPQDIKKWLATDRAVIESGQPRLLLDHVACLDGSLHWHRTRKLPLTLANGVQAVLVICEDVTDVKQAEEELAKERDLLQALMDNIPDSIYFKDRESRFIRINAHKARRFGLSSPGKAVGRTDLDFYPEAEAREYLADDRRVVGGERIVGKTEHHLAGATERWSLTSKAPFYGRDGQVLGIVGVSKDITDLKRMERELGEANEQLQRLAREDALTKLLNRRTLLELAENEWARWQRYGKPFSVLVLDADDFKSVNDNYGHLAGDHALKLLATILAQSIRNTDTVGRYGGEEFIVLLPETNLDGARVAGEKILQGVHRAALHWNGRAIQVTVSIGAAMSALADRDLDALLYRADTALYAAKRNGKNQFVAAPA